MAEDKRWAKDTERRQVYTTQENRMSTRRRWGECRWYFEDNENGKEEGRLAWITMVV